MYYQDTSVLLWRQPGDLVGRFYNVNVYNMYILLEVFNEDHMLYSNALAYVTRRLIG